MKKIKVNVSPELDKLFKEKKEQHHDRVLNYLKRDRPASAATLEKTLKIPHGSMVHALRKLMNENKITTEICHGCSVTRLYSFKGKADRPWEAAK